MTIDHRNQQERAGQGSIFQTLTVVFAGVTLLLALLSIFIGNHLFALHADRLAALQKNNVLENESIVKNQTELEKARANLEFARQETEAERQKAGKLSQKLVAAEKELEKVRADLEAAKQAMATVHALPTAAPAVPAGAASPERPSDMDHSTPPGPLPTQNPPPRQTPPSLKQPPVEAPSENPPAQSLAPVPENSSTGKDHKPVPSGSSAGEAPEKTGSDPAQQSPPLSQDAQ